MRGKVTILRGGLVTWGELAFYMTQVVKGYKAWDVVKGGEQGRYVSLE